MTPDSIPGVSSKALTVGTTGITYPFSFLFLLSFPVSVYLDSFGSPRPSFGSAVEKVLKICLGGGVGALVGMCGSGEERRRGEEKREGRRERSGLTHSLSYHAKYYSNSNFNSNSNSNSIFNHITLQAPLCYAMLCYAMPTAGVWVDEA